MWRVSDLDPGCARILEIVKDCNIRGQEICQKDIFDLKLAAPPTVNKKIRTMLEDGDLIGMHVQTPHGTKKLLFVPECYADADQVVTHRLLATMNYQLRRIADSLEKAQGKDPGRRDDGMVQVSLWEGDE